MLYGGKIDGDGISLPISSDSHLLVQIMELLFVGLPLYLFCLALAALEDLDLVVEVAQPHDRVDLLRTQKAEVRERHLDVVDEPFYHALALVHQHLYYVPVLYPSVCSSHRAVVS